jgi:hypothetical protein
MEEDVPAGELERESAWDEPEENVLTLGNIGRGLAFMGIVLFIAYGIIFWLAVSQPQLFHLFTGPEHFITISIVCLAMVIGGYALTKLERENGETNKIKDPL